MRGAPAVHLLQRAGERAVGGMHGIFRLPARGGLQRLQLLALGAELHLRAYRFEQAGIVRQAQRDHGDRKSTRLNSSHVKISYAVFCLKKKKKHKKDRIFMKSIV